MKKETIYRKVLVSERLPSNSGSYMTSSASGVIAKKYYNSDFGHFIYQSYHGDILKSNVEYWLEEIQLPSEEEVKTEVRILTNHSTNTQWKETIQLGWDSCANYILGFINNKK